MPGLPAILVGFYWRSCFCRLFFKTISCKVPGSRNLGIHQFPGKGLALGPSP